MTRSEILQLIDTNILDNSSKMITAAMVREVLDAMSNSGYNIESDLVKNLTYDTGVTMQDLVNQLMGSLPIWGYTGTFAFGGSSGAIPDVYGDMQSATKTRLGNEDTMVTITFKPDVGDITNKRVVVNVFTDSEDLNGNNDLGTPVVKQYSNSIKVGLRSFGGIGPAGIRLQVLIFTNQ